ncbi:MAG: GNAT family N-acetyltransferase [Rhodospirillaceae bacterium]
MSTLRALTPDDRPVLQSFLERHRASSMFLRSNLEHGGLSYGGLQYQGYYAGSFDGNVLTDVAAHYWNDNIILQAPEHPLNVAQAVVKNSGRAVNGVLGPWSQVQAVEPHLDLDRSRMGKIVPEHLYALQLSDLKVPSQLASGHVRHRLAHKDDLPTLVAWRRVYDRITMGFPEHAISDMRNADMLGLMIEDQRLWVLVKEGILLTMTGFNAILPDTVQVGGVFTPEQHRGHGYARSAVAASLLDARDVGVTEALLFTEMDNYPAQKAYEALGFVNVGDYGMVVLNPS